MSSSPTAPMQIGLVTLNVNNLDATADFYRRLLGLSVLDRDGRTLRLGAGTTPLLELRSNSGFARRSPRAAGLYHTAFLMPGRDDLGVWLRFMAEAGIPVSGASDHLVSEAVYLDDPEGNGIEVYADRPRSVWTNSDGQIAMSTERLDIGALMALAPERQWGDAPEGLIVGHLHLQVGDLARAEPFYAGILGADITTRYPGATFYGAGGYHHQLATNIWSSRGAGPVEPNTTGLVGYELILDTAAQRQAILERAEASSLTDPYGLEVALATRQA